MLIIEGSDDLGKTTAAKRIVEIVSSRIPAEYRHMGRPTANFDFGKDYFKMIEPFVVQDRFHYGSLIWHEGVMNATKFSVIEGKIRSIGGMSVVFVTTDVDWYVKQLQASERKQMFNVDQLVNANARYQALAAKYADFMVGVPQFITDENLEIIADEWLRRLEFAGMMP
jgi:thymidylate kinase